MATIGANMTNKIIREVYLFKLIKLQNAFKNKFIRKFVSLATIKQGIAIGF